MTHHQHRIKSLSHQFMKASQFEKEPRKYRLLRYFFLLLLMFYAGGSVLRLASTSSPSYSSLVKQSGDEFLAEKSRDVESFKTHISSAKNHLQVHEGKGSETSFSCSELIDGLTSTRTPHEGFLCCDRSHQRTDVCYLKGDIRTNAQSSSIFLHGAREGNSTVETIRPYTRKWETQIMSTIDELKLRRVPVTDNNSGASQCSVHHNVPAIVFSTGGYTGNVYHEFNDGLIPLFITAERFKGEVVLVMLEYHSWWKTKYASVVKKLSNYKMVDFSNDPRVHCFSEMIVGLKIHGELTVDPKLMHNGRYFVTCCRFGLTNKCLNLKLTGNVNATAGKGIHDFQSLLGQGFGDRQSIQLLPPELALGRSSARPKLAIFIRHKSRVLQNLRDMIKICERIGFDVQILNPRRTTPLSEIYTALNSSHAMLAVHGAAMTHFLFMRPGSVLIQIVPLGLVWAAEAYYGEPARNLGLRYIAYKIAPEESSLYRQYDRRSPVIRDPDAITSKGWSETKRIYLERQNVRVNLRKFGRLIAKVHSDIVHRLHM